MEKDNLNSGRNPVKNGRKKKILIVNILVITVLLLSTTSNTASAHTAETYGLDIFADVPYRIDAREKYIPILVEVKDAGSGGILEAAFDTVVGAVGGFIVGSGLGFGATGGPWGAIVGGTAGAACLANRAISADNYCDYDLQKIEIYWDQKGDDNLCCDDHKRGQLEDDCNRDCPQWQYPDDRLLFVKSYVNGNGDNLELSDEQRYNMYEAGDWYDIINIPKSGYDLNKNEKYDLTGTVYLRIVFVEDDTFDDCFDDDSYSLVVTRIDNYVLPEIEKVIGNEYYYGGDTHYHSSLTDLGYFYKLSNEFGNPVQATAETGKSLGLDWTTITDHSQEMDTGRWTFLTGEIDKFSSNYFKLLRGEEVSCRIPEIPPELELLPEYKAYNELIGADTFDYHHYLAYNISQYLPGYESPFSSHSALQQLATVCFSDAIGVDNSYLCEKAINVVNDQGGFGYVAHPESDDTMREPWPHKNPYMSLDFKGFELWNDDPVYQRGWFDLWKNDIETPNYNYFVEAGSDAHGTFSPVYAGSGSPYGIISTWCYMCGFSKDNVWNALKNGHCYMRSTDDPAIDFNIDGARMGESIKVPVFESANVNVQWNLTSKPPVALNISIYSGPKILNTTITSETNGSLIFRFSPQSCYPKCAIWVRVQNETPTQYDPLLAVTNPIWVIADGRDCVEPHTYIQISKSTKFCPGTYKLNPCQANGETAAIEIVASNLELDCNGAIIIGNNAGIGIRNLGYRNVTIKNCNLSKYNDGILLEARERNHFSRNSLFSNIISDTDSGNHFSRNSLFSNIISDTDSGIHLRNNLINIDYAPNSIYDNSIFRANFSAINLENVSYNHIEDNTIQDSLYGVLSSGNSSDNSVMNNKIYGKNGNGIAIQGCTNCDVRTEIHKNDIRVKNGVGVYVSGNRCDITSNMLFLNLEGIRVENGNNNQITDNTIMNNTIGISLKGSCSGNILRKNNLKFSGNQSLLLQGSKDICNNDIDQSNFADSADTFKNNIKVSRILPIMFYHDTTGLNINQTECSSLILCNVTDSAIDNVKVPSLDGLRNDGIFLLHSKNITMTNLMSSSNRIGLSLYGSFNNTISNSIFNENALYGVTMGGASEDNDVSSNEVCYNGLLDFSVSYPDLPKGYKNNGTKNRCDLNDGWKDISCNRWQLPTGKCVNYTTLDSCTYICGFEVIQLKDTTYISNNSKLACNATYTMSDVDGIAGVIQINSDDVILDCCNATLIGDGYGVGIYNPGFDRVVIRNCVLKNFRNGILLEKGSDSNLLYNNKILNSEIGANIDSSSNIELLQNTICQNSKVDIQATGTEGTGSSNTCDVTDGWSDAGKQDNCTMRCTPALPARNACYCSSCKECTDMLNDPACDIVYLTNDIFLQHDNCIDNPPGFNNKTFDGQKHLIEGDDIGSDYGIFLKGPKNGATIKNVVISGFNTGIYLEAYNTKVQNIQLSNNFITSNIADGIVLKGVFEAAGSIRSFPEIERVIIENNLIAQNGGDGIALTIPPGLKDSSKDVTVLNNRIASNSNGIALKNFAKATLSKNTVYSNREAGVSLSGSLQNTILENTIRDNQIGIQLKQGSDNSLFGNLVCGNKKADFDSSGGTDHGEKNLCDNPDGWNDANSQGCTYRCPVRDTCYCSGCEDCTKKLYDPVCGTVLLDRDISSKQDSCIQAAVNPWCYYYFNQSKSYRFCINTPIGFDNKIFDCQNHRINGSGSGNGIELYSADYNEIRSCVLTNFEKGLYISKSDGNTFTNIRAYNNSFGMYIRSSSDNSIYRNNFTGNYLFSLFTKEECNNSIKANTGGRYGKPILYINDTLASSVKGGEYSEIILCNATKATIRDLILSNGNNSDGILIFHSNDSYLANVTSTSNFIGLELWRSSGSKIEDCVFNSNLYGINLELTNNSSVDNCEIRSNILTGINLWRAYRNNVTRNNLNSSTSGMYLLDSHDNIVAGNVISNGELGIMMRDSTGNAFSTNIIENQNSSGIIDFSTDQPAPATPKWPLPTVTAASKTPGFETNISVLAIAILVFLKRI